MSLQVSHGFVLQVPAMGAQTLSWPCPSHWYSQSSLYSVTHSVSVYGSYSVLYCSTHTFLYTVLHCFSYTVLHSCLVVGWHSLCVWLVLCLVLLHAHILILCGAHLCLCLLVLCVPKGGILCPTLYRSCQGSCLHRGGGLHSSILGCTY